jgi:hypothetical protein
MRVDSSRNPTPYPNHSFAPQCLENAGWSCLSAGFHPRTMRRSHPIRRPRTPAGYHAWLRGSGPGVEPRCGSGSPRVAFRGCAGATLGCVVQSRWDCRALIAVTILKGLYPGAGGRAAHPRKNTRCVRNREAVPHGNFACTTSCRRPFRDGSIPCTAAIVNNAAGKWNRVAVPGRHGLPSPGLVQDSIKRSRYFLLLSKMNPVSPELAPSPRN